LTDLPSYFHDKIETAWRLKSPVLDLSDSSAPGFSGDRLATIPREVFDLPHLESLDLSNNQLLAVPEEIGRLRNLKLLRLRNNYIETVPAAIGLLSSLEMLDLSNNLLTSLPAEIGSLSRLRTLRAGSALSRLPKELGELRNLTSLSLVADRKKPVPVLDWLTRLRNITELELVNFSLAHLPNVIAGWKDLRLLDLSGNRLTEIPKWFAGLQKLTVLSCPANQLAEAPACLGELNGLQSLTLKGNRISTISASLGRLQNLVNLDLSDNRLETIPSTFSDLASLQTFDLAGNHLVEIPAAIYRLNNLVTLNLSKNSIQVISSDLLRLDKLQSFQIARNPVRIPPPEIAFKGLDAIRTYFRQIADEGMDELYEAKLLIIGEGGAGKTTLARKIKDATYQLQEEASTRGIDIVRWRFPLHNGRIFQVNIWDFGGQEIYHATHQFFLTKRSLYALVADTRREDTDFYYWLNVAELLSDGSPILIIKNEKEDRHREIDERALRGRFNNLKEIITTNLATGRGLDKVTKEIRHQIAHLPHVGTPLPSTWVRVREALEQDPRNYISREDYLAICEKNGFALLRDKLQLSEYLHDLGVCLHFQDDPLLKKTVILRPKWGTDAVYKVLDNPNVVRNLGHFTRADLGLIWDEPEYAAVQDELLELMMKFKLCYSLPGVAGNYIAPQLLSANQPEFDWEETENLYLRYAYDFRPKGILTQFIVAMHDFIAEQRLVWKTGVVLAKDQTLAEVKEHYDQPPEIRIRVTGRYRKELLVIAMHELDKIHASFPRLEYRKLVPCNCSVCRSNPKPHFYELSVLRQFSEDRQPIQCQKSYEMVAVLGLVDDVVGREQLSPPEARAGSLSAEDQRAQILFQGPIDKVVVQHTSGGESTLRVEERRDDDMAKPPRNATKARSAWANGSFYLFTFVVVVVALGLLAKSVPWYVLPAVLVAGAIFVPLVGALQLRMDEGLSQKSFLELMKLVVGQLPLIRRAAERQDE